MFNKTILAGNLTRDIELRYTQGGSAIAKTAIATSRKFTAQSGEKKEETCFIDITFFGRSAEIANQYLAKGSKVLIEGRLQFEQWESDGQKRSKHSIIVESMQMLGSRNDGQQQQAQPQPRPTHAHGAPVHYEQYTPPQQPNHTDYQPKPQPRQNAAPQHGLIDDDMEIPF